MPIAATLRMHAALPDGAPPRWRWPARRTCRGSETTCGCSGSPQHDFRRHMNSTRSRRRVPPRHTGGRALAPACHQANSRPFASSGTDRGRRRPLPRRATFAGARARARRSSKGVAIPADESRWPLSTLRPSEDSGRISARLLISFLCKLPGYISTWDGKADPSRLGGASPSQGK